MAIKDSHADSGMEDFGYRQSLDRSIGKFASFAAGVSYISILTGTFQLFYFGFGTAGPAYLWSWPMVFVGQMAVALCFMELAAKYPVAGSVYNWSKKLGSRLVGWSSGWLMLTASIVTISAVVLAAERPEMHRDFLEWFAGAAATSPAGHDLSIGLSHGRIDVVTPDDAAELYGSVEVDPHRTEFAAYALRVPDIREVGLHLEAGGVPYQHIGSRIVVPASAAQGVAISFEPA